MGNAGSSCFGGPVITVVSVTAAVAAAALTAWKFTPSSPPPENSPGMETSQTDFGCSEFIFEDREPITSQVDDGHQKLKEPATKGKPTLEQHIYSRNRQNRESDWNLKVDVDYQIPKVLKPNPPPQETIKIISYNILCTNSYKRTQRMKAISSLVEQHSPDIILLQEVTPEIYKFFKSCMWWRLYECSVSSEKAPGQYFCMMLSKLPVINFVHCSFVNTVKGKGLLVAGITTKSNKKLVVATCHLKSPNGSDTYSVERVSQAKEAVDLLNYLPNVVLGGDMNWDETRDGPFPLFGRWRDAWTKLRHREKGCTYDTVSNGMLSDRRNILQKRLDRFICRLKDFTMINIELIGTEAIKGVSYKSNGKKLPLLPSDHYGLILTICPNW